MSMSMNQLHQQSQICNFCLKKFECDGNTAKLRCCKNCFDEINSITLVTQQGNIYSLYAVPSMFNPSTNIEQKQQEPQTILNPLDFFTDLKKLIAQQVQNTIEKWRNIHQLYQDCPKTFINKNEDITTILYCYNDKINSIKNQMFEQILKLDEWKKQISFEEVSIDNPEEIKQGNQVQLLQNTIQSTIEEKKEILSRATSQKKIIMKKVYRKNTKIQPQAVFYEDNTNTINWKKGVTFSTGQRNLYDLDQQSLLSKSEFYTKMNNLKRKIFQYLLQQNKTPITLCRLHVDSIYQIVINTTTANKCIELVSYKITQNFSFGCYLAMLDWSQVQILKLVKVNLTDKIMVSVIDFLQYHDNKIETLVLTNNRITEQSIKYLQKAQLKSLKNIYLGKNAINSLKARKQLKKVKQLYNIYI